MLNFHNKLKFCKSLIGILIIHFLTFPLYSEENITVYKINKTRILEFESLNSYHNDLFKDFTRIVENNYKLSAAGKTCEIIFYKYKVQKNDTLFSIASRCCINYDTIATLNNISSINDDLANQTILIPTVQGLFISKQNKSALNTILIEKYTNEILTNIKNCYIIDEEEFIFLQNQRLDGITRFYFLDSGLKFPLQKDSYWISSDFGKRQNPFSGKWKNHNGIDLAASEGTEVYAIKDGKVAVCIQNDNIFGNYIIISHDDGRMTSVYAHLQKALVKNSDNIKKGDVIGYVGSTGQVTGPHLHFEIRQDGQAKNPRSILKMEN